jgi:putative component of toxin-antitoxin plasmid stabilization module
MLKKTEKLLFLTFIKLPVLFVILYGLSAPRNVRGNCKHYIANDTIWVYDTIVIYDTIWVYDTIYTDRVVPPEKLSLLNVDFASLKNESTGYQFVLEQTPKGITRLEIEPKKKEKNEKEWSKRIRSTKRRTKYQAKRLTYTSKGNRLDTKSFRKGMFDMELVIGPVFQATQYQYKVHNPVIDSIKSNTNDLIGMQYGIRLHYQVYQLSLTSGIGINQYRENSNYHKMDDSFEDTLASLNPKTNHIQLEVPLILGYHWQYPTTDFCLQLGAINQFHLYSNGKTYTNSGTLDDVETVMDFTSYNMALHGGIAGSYKLSKRVSIGVEVYYKYPLKKFASVQDMSIYKQSYGLNFTLKYCFQK